MEQWYRIKNTPAVEFGILVKKNLYNVQSKSYQIDVFESVEFGRVLCVDGQLMHTEKDEFIYHEMMTHVPMAVNPKIQDVLVVGVGDGGIVKELLKYPGIRQINVIEPSETLVAAVKKFMPATAPALSDPRVVLEIADDIKFTRRIQDAFDLIIVDIPDPFGPGENYFTKEYFGNCYTALRSDGILITQQESCFYENDAAACQKAHKPSVRVFEISKSFQASIPTYASGHWLFGFSSKKYHPTRDLRPEAWDALKIKTKYYNTRLHVGAFALPTYVEEILKEVE
jgi:spermidine synthase